MRIKISAQLLRFSDHVSAPLKSPPVPPVAYPRHFGGKHGFYRVADRRALLQTRVLAAPFKLVTLGHLLGLIEGAKDGLGV